MNKRKTKKRQSASIRQMNAYLISKCMARDAAIAAQNAQISELVAMSEALNICVIEAFDATEVTLSLDNIHRALDEKKLVVEVKGDSYIMRVEDKLCDTQKISTET